MSLRKIVSGGQTVVDRAALDAALELGIVCGGWCPKGRLAEDGRIASRYPLTETASEDYAQRTERNVRDSDGTLIINRGAQLVGGTAQTREVAARLNKPCLVIDLTDPLPSTTIFRWLNTRRVRTLNVAGPRESKQPGISVEAFRYLRDVLCSLWRPSLSGGMAQRRVETAPPRAKKPANARSSRR